MADARGKKRIYRAASMLQVAHVRNVLAVAGIDCEIRNEYLSGAMGELPMIETWPQIFIDAADEPRALRALASAAAPNTGPPWVCTGCGEVLEPQFTSCWRCGAEPAATGP